MQFKNKREASADQKIVSLSCLVMKVLNKEHYLVTANKKKFHKHFTNSLTQNNVN